MRYSIIIFAFFAFTCIALVSCSNYKVAYLKLKNSSGKKEYRNKKVFFQEYALCSCLLQSNTTDTSINKDASQSVYFDLSDGDLYTSGIGKSIDSNAAAYIYSRMHKSGATFENRKTPILDCISYYKSAELSSFIDSLVKTRK